MSHQLKNVYNFPLIPSSVSLKQKLCTPSNPLRNKKKSFALFIFFFLPFLFVAITALFLNDDILLFKSRTTIFFYFKRHIIMFVFGVLQHLVNDGGNWQILHGTLDKLAYERELFECDARKNIGNDYCYYSLHIL